MASLPTLGEIQAYITDHAPTAVHHIERPYHYVFPEYPFAGVLVILLALVMFLFYVFKSGVELALKMAIFIIVALTLILLCLHWLNGPFHLMAG